MRSAVSDQDPAILLSDVLLVKRVSAVQVEFVETWRSPVESETVVELVVVVETLERDWNINGEGWLVEREPSS